MNLYLYFPLLTQFQSGILCESKLENDDRGRLFVSYPTGVCELKAAVEDWPGYVDISFVNYFHLCISRIISHHYVGVTKQF